MAGSGLSAVGEDVKPGSPPALTDRGTPFSWGGVGDSHGGVHTPSWLLSSFLYSRSEGLCFSEASLSRYKRSVLLMRRRALATSTISEYERLRVGRFRAGKIPPPPQPGTARWK
eukprot:1765936-Prymnesium_polylepis.1